MTTEPHWATVRADGIVYAAGYCWCGNADAEKHFIQSRPPAN